MSTEALFWALKAKIGNPYRKLILLVLADISNDLDQCWPSHDYIASMAECKRRVVINHLTQLEQSGFITIERRFTSDNKQTSNVYTLKVARVHKMHSGVHEKPARGALDAHNTPIDTPIGINNDAWDEWRAYRAKRKKITADAQEKQWRLLKQYTHAEQQEIIDTSIQNDWQGLFPLKAIKNENTKQPINGFKDTRRLSGAERTRLARERAFERERLAVNASGMGCVEPD